MNNIQKITIQSFCLKDKLSDLNIAAINSYLKQGYDYHLYSYYPLKWVHPNVTIKNANDIINVSEVWPDKLGSFEFFIHLFKLTLLYKIGGWWCDIDVFCNRHFITSDNYFFFALKNTKTNRIAVVGKILKSPIAAGFLADQINEIKSVKQPNVSECNRLFSLMIFKHNLQSFIVLPKYFDNHTGLETLISLEKEYFLFPEYTNSADRYFQSKISKTRLDIYEDKRGIKHPEFGRHNAAVNAHSKDQKLLAATIIIPVELESPDDRVLIYDLIKYIESLWPTDIIVIEFAAKAEFKNFENSKIQHRLFSPGQPVDQKTAVLNQIIKEVKTNVFCIWGQIGWVAQDQLIKALNQVRYNNVDVSYPYSSIYFLDEIMFYIFKKKRDFGFLQKNVTAAYELFYPLYSGHIFFANKARYIQFGMGNVKIKTQAFISRELYYRVKKLQGTVVFCKGKLFLSKRKPRLKMIKNEDDLIGDGGILFDLIKNDNQFK